MKKCDLSSMIPVIRKAFEVGEGFESLPSEELYLEMYRMLSVEGATAFGEILAKLCEMGTALDGAFARQVSILEQEIFGLAIQYRESARSLYGPDKESARSKTQFFESLSQRQLAVLARWQVIVLDLARSDMADDFEEDQVALMQKVLDMFLAMEQESRERGK